MSLTLASPITELSGIGPAKAKLFSNLNITHVRDLLFSFPRRHEDFSTATAIKDLKIRQQMTVKGTIKRVKSDWGWQGKRRLLRIYVDVVDDTGVLHITWYNLRFLAKQLPVGREIYLAGQIEAPHFLPDKHDKQAHFAMRSPAMEFPDRGPERTHTAAITPIYAETKGVSSRFILYQIKKILPLVNQVPEYLPADIIKRHNLISIQQAISFIHFPPSKKELNEAEKRLKFDELFFLQLAALVRRRQWQQYEAPVIASNQKIIKHLIKTLPFNLTSAQANAFQEICDDLAKDQPMNRLLQGDVGSGKSAVALLATKLALEQDYKVLYLAPTEILARQQAKHFIDAIGKHQVELLIGATSAAAKSRIKHRLMMADAVCVIGTHALLQDDITAQNVGLAIIDEQHRFGVAQRSALISSSDNPKKKRTHLLSMTATPIPRTLNLTVYGDLDVSVLDELPPGRKPVTTKIIPPQDQTDAIVHVLEEIHAGHQAYVITALVEESLKIKAKSAKKAFLDIQNWFPGIAIGLLHGQMSATEKESVMAQFAEGAIQILVSTAVVEVGINVPNATVMIIEGAERFGLAQLHQFRGRIGRGEAQSFCYLFPTTIETSTLPRLQILAQQNDGFKIAEEDLRLRGPGEVYGLSQSGFGDLQVATLLDYPAIKQARTEAQKILEADPELASYPILRKKVAQKNARTHFE